MTNIDLTDIRQFVFSWLPSALRGNISELACVLVEPFHGIHQRYLDYKREKTYLPWLLNYNWSAQSMEDMLNNYFGIESSDSRIRVEDAPASDSLRIYRNADNRAKKLGTLKVSSHRTWLAAPFVVQVPSEVYDNNTDETVSTIRNLVNILKLYGLKFTIVRYE